jgi:hypothetical protein
MRGWVGTLEQGSNGGLKGYLVEGALGEGIGSLESGIGDGEQVDGRSAFWIRMLCNFTVMCRGRI